MVGFFYDFFGNVYWVFDVLDFSNGVSVECFIVYYSGVYFDFFIKGKNVFSFCIKNRVVFEGFNCFFNCI